MCFINLFFKSPKTVNQNSKVRSKPNQYPLNYLQRAHKGIREGTKTELEKKNFFIEALMI
jgi:hypothetical protein